METVGKQKQYLRPERVYSQEYIQKRMGMSFGRASHLLTSVLAKCSEVSQSLMYELLEWHEPTVTVERKGGSTNREYYCSNCRKHKIRAMHNYCPECGHKIKWIN